MRQVRSRHGPAARVANHSGKIADDQNCLVPEVLKLPQFSQNDRMAKVNIRCGRVHPKLDTQRLAQRKLLAQFAFIDDLRRALFQQRKSFVRLHERLQYRHSERSRGIPWQKLKVTSRGVDFARHDASALLVFVQQLAHLLDRERFVLSIERLLICALVQKGPITCIRTRGDLFSGLRCITNAASGLICIGSLGICNCLLRRNVRGASAAVGLRIKLRCGEVSCSGIIF